MSWCNSRTPAQVVAPGDEVQFEVIDAVCGQLSPESTVEDVENLDFDLVNPISGPIYVDGAEPGDSLKVTILGFEPSGWGWTAIIPGFGLLADDFANPSLNIWKYELGFETPCVFNSHARVPLKPFCGTIGVAHAEAGEF
ncbi:MAG: acetamidase/formamidase family protein, partial [Coleofasciculus sp. C2-GNP5-27]